MKSANAHQDFFINEPEKNRVKIVRQDRIHVNEVPCFLEINGDRHEVTNFSAFGVAIKVKTQWSTNQEFQECAFLVEQFEVASLHIKSMRSEITDDDQYIIGFEVLSMPIPIEQVNALFSSYKITRSLINTFAASEIVPVQFREIVWRCKEYLENLKQKITELEQTAPRSTQVEHLNFETTICQFFSKHFVEFFNPVYDQLFNQLSECTTAQKNAAFTFFRDSLKKLIYDAPFADRSFNKPLGYAGDYDMMNLIYRPDLAGNSLFAKCLNYYFVNEPAALAVKNRAAYLREKLITTLKSNPSKKMKFLSVACGPAMEVQNLIKENGDLLKGRDITFHLLDQDESALKFTQRTIKNLARERNLNIEVQMVHKAIKNIITRGLPERDYDMIYSAGLFDYFADPVAQLAGTSLFNSIKQDGELIIGNFNTTNPTKFLMAIALDWNLIYRTPDQMKQLFSHIEGQAKVEQEPTGINLFFCVCKKTQ